jgi:cytochrome c553
MSRAVVKSARAGRFVIGSMALACSMAAVLLHAASSTYAGFHPADAARGKGLAAPCMACHGASSLTFGDVPYHAPKLGGQRASAIFRALLDYRDGRRHDVIMPPIAAVLPLQDMRDVAAYLAGEQIKPSFAPVPNSWARAKVMDDCAACHGETGLGVMEGYPIIGGQYQDYLVHALRRYKSGERGDPTMIAMARKLTDKQIVELAAYFDSLSDRDYLRAAR